ncbi:unnamed protein product [Closterium sp. Yama58-4]|nr:unnamed protein product [Closterium sp. Yama58-4]
MLISRRSASISPSPPSLPCIARSYRRRIGHRCIGYRRIGYRRIGYRRIGYRRIGYRRIGYRRIDYRRLGRRRIDGFALAVVALTAVALAVDALTAVALAVVALTAVALAVVALTSVALAVVALTAVALAVADNSAFPTKATINAGKYGVNGAVQYEFPTNWLNRTVTPQKRRVKVYNFVLEGLLKNAESITTASGKTLSVLVMDILKAPRSYYGLVTSPSYPNGAIRGQLYKS